MDKINVNRTGYKGFNVREDGTLYCRDMTFEVGKVARVKGAPVICQNGIHFCWNINDVNLYYNLCDCVVCEVRPLGDIVASTDGTKCCTNELKVLRMLTKEEVLRMSNSGHGNSGFCNAGNCNTGDWNTGNRNAGNRNTGNRNAGNRNTGDWNTGDCNTGDWNAGNRNTGDWNTGDWNTGNRNTGNRNAGNRNTGNRNTGDCNTGDWNTGNRNAGNRNTGDWNTGDCNTGFFNQKENKCYIFDEMSDMTPTEFRTSEYYRAIRSAPFVLTEWIWYTDKEKEYDKAKELIGGYLKKYSWEDACARWWKALSKENKQIVKSIPGFTKKKFKDITGISTR